MIHSFLNYITNNKDWIFSGIGIFFITTLCSLLQKLFKKNNTQMSPMTQINQNSSTGTQIGTQINNYSKETTYDNSKINTNDPRK